MWQSTTKDFVRVTKNNDVLIKEIIAGLIQPKWVQRPWGSSPMVPKWDSRVFMVGSSVRPATCSSPGRLTGTRSEDKWARPKRTSWNLRNRPPLELFRQKKSVNICSVWQYRRVILSVSRRSVIKNIQY